MENKFWHKSFKETFRKKFQQQPKLTYEFLKVQMEITRHMCLKMWTASTEIKRQFPVDILYMD